MIQILAAFLLASSPAAPVPGLSAGTLDAAPGTAGELALPDGTAWPLTVLRNEPQASGTRVWTAQIGEDASPYRMVVTWSPDAIFGWIETPEGNWQIAPAAPGGAAVLGRVTLAADERGSDAILPSRRLPRASAPAADVAEDVAIGANGTVDIAVVYTAGMETLYGLGVIARAQHLVNVLDQALIDSDTGLRARLVHAEPVGTPWDEFTSTLETIDDLIAGASFGHPGTYADVFGSCDLGNGAQCTNNGDLSHLLAMRDAKAADIVIMLRRYWRQQQTFCGVAFLPGGGAEGVIDPAEDDVYGVAVSGDGPDGNGTGASCGDLTFAHEIGHNLGSHHNVENAGGQFGLFTWSYGHRVDCQFRTIMGYDSTRSGVACPGNGANETWLAAFSNPERLTCFGQACGIAADEPATAGADDNTTPADNARSIRSEGWRVRLYREPPAPAVVSAILPSSRAVATGGTATAFATIVNPLSTGGTATACGLALHGGNTGGSFSYRTTDPATNAPAGALDTPADIPAGGSQSYVFSVSRASVLFQTDLRIEADCANRRAQTVISGLNTLLFTATASPGPDIIALSATPGGASRLTIPEPGQTRAFAVAVANAGVSGTVGFSAAAMPGASGIGRIEICRTNPATGQCETPRQASLSLTLAADATATFTVFVTASAAIANDPAVNRIQFAARTSPTGPVVGATSVAVRTGG